MPLAAEPRSPNLIVGYDALSVRLADRVLSSSALVTPGAVRDWPVRSVGALEGGFDALLALGVPVVLLATGTRQQFPAPALLGRAAAAGIGLEVMDVGAACRTYNLMVSDGRPVALALILPG